MAVEDWAQSIVPLSATLVGVPVMLWRIYRWIDVKTRQQIEQLESRLTVCETAQERLRSQRITEVDAERTMRIAAQDDAARLKATATTAEEDAARLRRAAISAEEQAERLRTSSLALMEELNALRRPGGAS